MSSPAGSADLKAALSVDDARDRLLADVLALEPEPVPLEDATGRVTAEAVAATADVPGFDSSAMDGFAIRSEDVQTAAPHKPVELSVVGESRAGVPWPGKLGPGQAIGISTGAMVPDGADAVLRVEDVVASGSGIVASESVASGCDIRLRAEVTRSGEVLLESGSRVGPIETGVLATAGCGLVICHRRPRVTLLVSGDELVEPGVRLGPGKIWNSNSYVISALVANAGGEVISTQMVPDQRDSVVDALKRSSESDVVLIGGGVSVGKHDHVRPALAALGVEQRFWGIALNPGRPAWYGTRGDTRILGLPGNPVSALVVFSLLADPMIRALCGEREQPARTTGRLASPVERHLSRHRAVPCKVMSDQPGGDLEPVAQLGSHDFISLRGAHIFALVPPGTGWSQVGELVEILPIRAQTLV